MAKNKPPRKRCKSINDQTSPRFSPLYLLGPVEKDSVRDLYLKLHTAHLNIKEGHGTAKDYETVVLGIDIGRELALADVGFDEYAQHWVGAFEAFKRMQAKGAQQDRATARYVYEAPMIKHVDAMVEVHLAQLQCITMRELRQAEQTLIARRVKYSNELKKAAA